MRYKMLLLLLIYGLISFISCENDFVISTDSATKPLVYAIIDPQDSIHYIKIGKAFSGNNNAYESALIADSIAFQEVYPNLEFYTQNGWKYKEYSFYPCKDIVKDAGIFSTGGIQIYELQADIQNLFIEGSYMVLNMNYSDNEFITSQVQYNVPPKITAPKQGINTLFEFYSPYYFVVKFEDPAEFNRYQLHIRMFYSNIHLEGDTTQNYVDKVFLQNSHNQTEPRSKSRLSIPINGDLLLAKYKMDIPLDPSVKYRLFDHIDIILITGSCVFYDYLDLQIMADDYGGGTISNVINGYGIFALKHQTSITGIRFGPISMDSLVNGRFTKDLGFIR